MMRRKSRWLYDLRLHKYNLLYYSEENKTEKQSCPIDIQPVCLHAPNYYLRRGDIRPSPSLAQSQHRLFRRRPPAVGLRLRQRPDLSLVIVVVRRIRRPPPTTGPIDDHPIQGIEGGIQEGELLVAHGIQGPAGFPPRYHIRLPGMRAVVHHHPRHRLRIVVRMCRTRHGRNPRW